MKMISDALFINKHNLYKNKVFISISTHLNDYEKLFL
jgi:hypothetical protein